MDIVLEKAKLEFAIHQLEQHIVHPMKPGYRRHDVMDKIKELKSQLADYEKQGKEA